MKFGQGAGPGGLDWGRPLLIVVLGLGAWRIWRIGRISHELWIVLALAATFWVLAGLNVKAGRGPTESRYLLPGAVFVLMIAGELLRGVRVPRAAIVAAYVLGALVVANNVYVLRDAYIAYRNTSDIVKADLGAVEIARDRIAMPFFLDQNTAGTAYVPVTTSGYLSAADAYGSPADGPSEIAAEPEPARVAADRVLGRATGGQFRPREECAGGIRPPSAGGRAARGHCTHGRELRRRRSARGDPEPAAGWSRRPRLAVRCFRRAPPLCGRVLSSRDGSAREGAARRRANPARPSGRAVGARPALTGAGHGLWEHGLEVLTPSAGR